MDISPRYQTVISDIYDASYQPEHWPVALAGIAELTASDSAALIYRDHQLSRASAAFFYNLSSELVDQHGQGDDPHFELFASSVPLGVATANHKLLPSQQSREAFYDDFFSGIMERYDLYYIGGTVLFNDETRAVGLALQRGRTSGPWLDDQLQHLTNLAPHIQRALHIHREFTRLRVREEAFRAGLDKLLIGVILFDQMLQPVYCNPIAGSILAYHPALRMQNDHLYASNKVDSEAIRQGLLKAVNASGNDVDANQYTAIGLRHPDHPTPLPLMIAPISETDLGPQAGELSAHAAVMFSDPERNQPIVPEALHTAYGLTHSEARVAIAIANGLSVEDIAGLHRTKASTVKSQLLAVYRKLGIKRQAELVKILLTGPFRVNF